MSAFHSGSIHEANINHVGRDYVDLRQINHFKIDVERDSK